MTSLMSTNTSNRFTFTLEPALKELLKQQAEKEFRSVGSLLNALIAKYLEEQGLEVKLESRQK